MTVYFLSPVGDGSRVKIGHSNDLNTRLQAISSLFENGIELLGVCDGDESTERAFHFLFEEDRIDSEWFKRSHAIARAIDVFSQNVAGRRVWSKLRPLATSEKSSIDLDRDLALALLTELMGKFGAIPFGVAQTKALEDLRSINPLWTHRRVRAIWERVARRIDHYEIQDLRRALENWDEPKVRVVTK